MSQQLLKRLERYRKRNDLSILALCRNLDLHSVTYHRWKKARNITGPYKKIIEDFLSRNDPTFQLPSKRKTSFQLDISKNSDIAVIGVSCHYPGAQNKKELWENILSRRIQFRRMLDQRLPLSDYYDENAKGEKSYLTKAAFVDGVNFNWSKWRIPKKVFESTDIAHWLALDTALKAFQDAGYKIDNIPTEKTGALVGNTLTGEQTRSQTLSLRWPFVQKVLQATLANLNVPNDEQKRIAQSMEQIYKSAFYPITEDSLAGGLANTIAGRICNFFDFKGGGYIVDGACSSSLLAVATAANALKSGQLDLALAGGVDVSLDPFELVGFSKAGALTKDQMRVYDGRASGFIPGEGCGFIVLKRLADAVRDKDYIYATIKGWGISSDGKGGIMEPSAEGQSYAIKRAYHNGYLPKDLDFIEGHGTGTARGDMVELEGMSLAVKGTSKKPLERTCGVTSFKSIVGHTKAAAGIGGLIKAIMAVNQRVLPPIANCSEPNNIFNDKAKCLYPIMQGEILNEKNIVRAGVSAAGFGGINCHITLESKDKPSDELTSSLDKRALLCTNQKTEIFVFCAKTTEQLLKFIRKYKQTLRFIAQAEMADFAYWLNAQASKRSGIKVAVVTDTPEHLYEAVCSIENEVQSRTINPEEVFELKSSSPQTKIIFGHSVKNSKIGFLFPGQAAQKLNMTRHLYERYEWARDLVKNFKQPIEKYIYRPLDKFLTTEEQKSFREQLSKTEITQPAVTLSSLIWLEYLSKLGIEPNCVAGHSLGELVALYKAGAFDQKTLLEFAEARGKFMASDSKGKAGMVSLFCPEDKASELVEEIKGNVVVANINSPKQIIVSGETKALKDLIKLADKKDIRSLILPVSNAFHSSFMSSASKKIKNLKFLKKEFKEKDIKFYSGIDGKHLDKQTTLNDYLSNQVISPVRFTNLVKEISKECDLLLEVGPSQILTGLVKQINTADGVKCLPLESSSENDQDLNNVLAELFIRGTAINFKELYRNRLIKPFVPFSRMKFIVNQCERPLKGAKALGALSLDIKTDSMDELIAQESTEFKAPQKVDSKDHVGTLLVDLVHDMTGFDKSSITLDLKLLDDLNLDSIKAGGLIAEATKVLGIAGLIDPSEHSNKKLSQVRDLLFDLFVKARAGQVEGQSEKNILRRYLNKGWVRDFVVEHIAQEIKAKDKVFLKEIKSACIVCEDKEKPLAKELEKQFSDLEIKISQSDYKEGNVAGNCIISILPKPNGKNLINGELLRSCINRFEKIIKSATEYKGKEKLTVVFVQFGANSVDIPSTCAKALASTLHLEWPELNIKVLDFDHKSSDKAISEKVIDEIAVNRIFSCASYDKSFKRTVPVFVNAEPCDYKDRNIKWSKDDVVIVTGGAKGITARCAYAFAQKYKTQMVLIGRSQIERDGNDEISQTLDKFKDAKLKAAYYSTDVTDPDEIKNLIKKIQTKYGKVTGIIHGAGLNSIKRLKVTNALDAYKESRVKVLGAVNLAEALARNNLKMFAALTSVIGVTGMEGSGWYGFANEALNLYLQDYKIQNKTTEVIALAYSVWDEVGMGVKLGTMKWLSSQGIGAIPIDEGVDRFMRLVDKTSGHQQTIITARTAGLDTWKTKEQEIPLDLRFIEDVKSFLPNIELIAQCQLNIKDDSYVLDHDWKGSLLWPLVFGLESMAQSYYYLTGINPKGKLKFTDVKLERAIPVNPDSGTKIEIHAIALEKENKNDIPKVKVDIYSDQTNFSQIHFSAVVEMSAKAIKSKSSEVKAPKKCIDLDMNADIYGPILFQSGPFQRIKKIHDLYYDDKTRKGQCAFTSSYDKASKEFLEKSKKFNDFLISDPFFMDSLFQSMQLIVAQDSCLPSSIREINIFNSGVKRSQASASSTLRNLSPDFHEASVLSIQSDGFVFSANDCLLKILEHSSERISTNDLASPENRVQYLAIQKLKKVCKTHNFQLPVLRFLKDDRLKQASKSLRHVIEKPLIMETVNELLKREGRKTLQNIQIKWLKSGKPILENKDLEKIRISLSHTGDLLVCVAGFGDQGIDIEIAKTRSKVDWRALLGNKNYELAENNVVTSGLDISYAGASAWSAQEAFKKWIGQDQIDMNILFCGKDVIVYGLQKKCLNVVSVPIKIAKSLLTLSLLVRMRSELPDNISSDLKISDGILKEFGFNKDFLFGVNLDYSGPNKEVVFAKKFMVTYKANQSISKDVYFTNFFDWMGNVREEALYPINKEFNKYMLSGDWGMVTNYSKLKILGCIRNGDTIESRIWMGDFTDKKKTTLPIYYEWRRLTDDQGHEIVASGKQSTSWVKIKGRGEVELSRYPDCFVDYMELFRPREESVGSKNNVLIVKKGLDMGLVKWSFKKPLGTASVLHQEAFITSLEDSNLVGNIYFSNYAKWLGKVADVFLHKVIPEYYENFNQKIEARCSDCEINYLNEAMPFQQIFVKMSLRELYENGLGLYFEFFIMKNGTIEKKLAYAFQEIVFARREDGHSVSSADVPSSLIKFFKGMKILR